MLIQFTEFNTGKLIYIDHCEISLVRAIENADKGALIQGGLTIHVQESPHDVVQKVNAAEKVVAAY